MTPQNVKKSAAVKVVTDIKSGPFSPAQKAAWLKFWSRIIAEAKSEAVKHDQS